VLLVEADNAQPGAGAPLVLEYLSVIHLLNCRVQRPCGASEEKLLSVIRCTGADRGLQEYFLRSLYPIMASLTTRPSQQQISRAVDRLVELFQKITQTPRKTLTGLWAELLLIARAHDPTFLLRAWHVEAADRFDFGAGSDRLEVKAAQGRQRVHHFSLEQLRPATGVRAAIASLLIERVQGGASINDLVDVIRSRVTGPEWLLHLDTVVAQTVGSDWRALKEIRFDLPLACESFRLFDAATIPAIDTPVPLEVTEVHFRVDLSRLAERHTGKGIEDSRLFAAALPDAALTGLDQSL
jgi:hypothetical protein